MANKERYAMIFKTDIEMKELVDYIDGYINKVALRDSPCVHGHAVCPGNCNELPDHQIVLVSLDDDEVKTVKHFFKIMTIDQFAEHRGILNLKFRKMADEKFKPYLNDILVSDEKYQTTDRKPLYEVGDKFVTDNPSYYMIGPMRIDRILELKDGSIEYYCMYDHHGVHHRFVPEKDMKTFAKVEQ